MSLVRANVADEDTKPLITGWLQMEKRTAVELQKLTMRSPTAMAALMLMVGRMSKTNALIMSQQAMADELGVTRKSINTAMALLEKCRFIDIVKVGTTPVYKVNTAVAWQGERGARFAHFHASVFAVEKEQERDLDIPQEPLKSVPVAQEGERLLVGNEPMDPPDQGELSLN